MLMLIVGVVLLLAAAAVALLRGFVKCFGEVLSEGDRLTAVLHKLLGRRRLHGRGRRLAAGLFATVITTTTGLRHFGWWL